MSQTLAEIQSRMQAHVLHGDDAALADVVAGSGLSPERRLGIYHHAYRARLTETMRDSFGHTLSYLGDNWFDHLAALFIAQHPSLHANLRWYGQGWPTWLATELVEGSAVGAHPEVAELAQLDWALRQAFDAADARVLSLGGLAAINEGDWTGAALPPQPSVSVLRLHHNTLSLWHALDQDEAVPPAERLAQPMGVLVWRKDGQPHFRSVSAMEALALSALLQGRSFEAICGELLAAFPGEDTAPVAATLLRRWVDDGVLSAQADLP